MSAGTREVLINPELTAKPGHPLGGIRGKQRSISTLIHRLDSTPSLGCWNGMLGPKGCNCSCFNLDKWKNAALVNVLKEISRLENRIRPVFFCLYFTTYLSVKRETCREVAIKKRGIFMSCLTRSKFPSAEKVVWRRMNLMHVCQYNLLSPSPQRNMPVP